MKSERVKFWTQGLRPSGRRSALYHLASYLRWRASHNYPDDPDKMIEECLNGTHRTLIDHLRVLKLWVEGEEFDGSEKSTRSKYYTDIRGFYKHNLCELPSSPLRTGSPSNVKVEVTAISFLEYAKRVVSSRECSVRDRAIVVLNVQTGMDDSTLAKVFNYVAYPQLVKQFGTEDWQSWNTDRCPVRIDLIRPKNGYRYYTFIAEDGLECLKQWLNVRYSQTGRGIKIYEPKRPDQLPTSDPIFLVEGDRPLQPYLVSKIFKDLGIKAGVNIRPPEKMERFKGAKRRYPFHSHEVRDCLVTLARRCKVDIAIANFFIGHNIDRYKYDKSPWDDPEHFRDQYRKLSKYLNILTGKEALMKEEYEKKLEDEVQRRDERLKMLEQQVSSLVGIIEDLRREGKLMSSSVSGRAAFKIGQD